MDHQFLDVDPHQMLRVIPSAVKVASLLDFQPRMYANKREQCQTLPKFEDAKETLDFAVELAGIDTASDKCV